MSDQAYRDHPFIANSDLKGLMAQFKDTNVPDNLEEIFSFGTLAHALILEPHLADYTHPDIERGLEMRDTFMKDPFCEAFISHPGFKPEHEFYRKDILGVPGKCKMDGAINSRKDILEFKSLSITTQSAFEEAVYHFDYDQGAAWYLDVSRYDRLLIVAISKPETKKLFKLLVTRDDDVYKSGKKKYTQACARWKELL